MMMIVVVGVEVVVEVVVRVVEDHFDHQIFSQPLLVESNTSPDSQIVVGTQEQMTARGQMTHQDSSCLGCCSMSNSN